MPGWGSIDKEAARELRAEGLSYQAIADFFGVSRQAVHSSLSEKKRPYKYHYKPRPSVGKQAGCHGNSDMSVHHVVGYAIKKGILIPAPCEECGAPESHAHHDDYNKPLEVRWL